MSNKESICLYIVVPCYNEQEVLHFTNEALISLINQLVEKQTISDRSKILYVDDGSKDDTWNLIEEYKRESCFKVGGIKLAGNTGHQNALIAGLSVAVDEADIIITIDADLQDDINIIPAMISSYKDGHDIVYGVRKSRATDTWFKRNTALCFYKLMKALGVRSVYNHADYRLMSKRAVKQLINYRERNLFLRGIIPLIGYNSNCVYYDRSERMAGESKYPLSRMMNFAIDGITSFSVKPVRMVFFMGLFFILIAICIFIFVLYQYFTDNVVQGWASLILSMWFIGGCILIGLGIVGEYIGKIYIEVKDRPRYNIEKII